MKTGNGLNPMPIAGPGLLVDNRTKQDGNRESMQPDLAAGPRAGTWAPSLQLQRGSSNEREGKSAPVTSAGPSRAIPTRGVDPGRDEFRCCVFASHDIKQPVGWAKREQKPIRPARFGIAPEDARDARMANL